MKNKPNALVAISKLMDRLTQSTVAIENLTNHDSSTYLTYQSTQNRRLLEAAHKAFDKLIETGIDVEFAGKGK